MRTHNPSQEMPTAPLMQRLQADRNSRDSRGSGKSSPRRSSGQSPKDRQSEALLDKLFAFLEREAPLNSLLAGYFGKIVSVLLSRRTDETLKVMDDKKVVPLLACLATLEDLIRFYVGQSKPPPPNVAPMLGVPAHF